MRTLRVTEAVCIARNCKQVYALNSRSGVHCPASVVHGADRGFSLDASTYGGKNK